ncbi:trypsin-like peptidase domain-containing protein [Rhodopirellula sp. P2]|uniref:trypsin-like peptidase domain-containing protein n=1 Tax=Rhodopirellula sp. P2 TaxID=2127060 RepID=UPI002367EDB5|nr:trypsin-like peptidase domain-containing protein [Rhodopirellula sp. P2]WDQ18422.1 trypsin-like peptidase domain-containing protein [Rhodopirellula sp. P2]
MSDAAVQETERTATEMQSSMAGLPELYRSTSRSIVRMEADGDNDCTGVIVSADGHILLGDVPGPVFTDATDAKVHLSDGRTATARHAGWSTEWGLSVAKINEPGPWPAIPLGSTATLKAGTPCLLIGYPTRGDTSYDSMPMLRLGLVDRTVPKRWLTTTGFRGVWEYPAIVGLDGRLLGIDTDSIDSQKYATSVDVLIENQKDLFAGKNLDWVRYPPVAGSVFERSVKRSSELPLQKTTDVLGEPGAPKPMDSSELSEVQQIAKRTTVRLVSKDRLISGTEEPQRWSGVIVSPDGYVLTCAHTQQLPGERFTVRLSDGRDADAVALGTNPISDIGLVKITTPGQWPWARISESSNCSFGDPIVIAGYPGGQSFKDETGRWTIRWLMDRSPVIGSTTVEGPSHLLWSVDLWTGPAPFLKGGMSGGGIFNRQGRYVGTTSGLRSELAKRQWDDLEPIDSIDTAFGLQHPLRKRFDLPGRSVAESVVEVLVDSQSVGVGTVISPDGWILAKASVLTGTATCRLDDGSVVEAQKRAELPEHDLALLKVDRGGMAAVELSDDPSLGVAEVLCAVLPDQELKPGIVSIDSRPIPPEPRWTGNVAEDTADGPKIARPTRFGWKNTENLSLTQTELRWDDVIISIDGHATPDVASLMDVLTTELSDYRTGDLVTVELIRGGSRRSVRTSLPPATVVRSSRIEKYDSPRRSGFVGAFDSDIGLAIRQVGGPVIDDRGHVRGIAIASRGRKETRRGPTTVLPSPIVRQAIERLMASVIDD